MMMMITTHCLKNPKWDDHHVILLVDWPKKHTIDVYVQTIALIRPEQTCGLYDTDGYDIIH